MVGWYWQLPPLTSNNNSNDTNQWTWNRLCLEYLVVVWLQFPCLTEIVREARTERLHKLWQKSLAVKRVVNVCILMCQKYPNMANSWEGTMLICGRTKHGWVMLEATMIRNEWHDSLHLITSKEAGMIQHKEQSWPIPGMRAEHLSSTSYTCCRCELFLRDGQQCHNMMGGFPPSPEMALHTPRCFSKAQYYFWSSAYAFWHINLQLYNHTTIDPHGNDYVESG